MPKPKGHDWKSYSEYKLANLERMGRGLLLELYSKFDLCLEHASYLHDTLDNFGNGEIAALGLAITRLRSNREIVKEELFHRQVPPEHFVRVEE